MSITFRDGGLGDAARLALLHRDCFEEKWDEASIAATLDNSATRIFLAVDAAANELQAFIMIQTYADESEILTLGTAPAARRKGLAKALLLHAAREAADYGARTMFLEVAENNAAALALYEHAGFVVQGRRKSYYRGEGGASVDALRLAAVLPL